MISVVHALHMTEEQTKTIVNKYLGYRRDRAAGWVSSGQKRKLVFCKVVCQYPPNFQAEWDVPDQ